MKQTLPFIAFLLLSACSNTLFAQQKKTSLFSLMNEKETGISFLNSIEEDDSLNVMRYEYLYNGAGVGVGDFNNDGLNDIFFSGNTTANKLFLNKGNFKFADITASAAVAGNGTWRTGVSIADVNGDGLMDIYVCHSGKYDDPEKLCNELFINQGLKDGLPYFKEMARDYGLNAPGTQSTQAAFFDYDKDGDLDMFLLNHSNHTYNPFINTKKIRSTPDFSFGNRLFRNDRDAKGNMHFTDVTLQAGIVNNALNFGLSVTISDLNNDGWPDIYTTSDYTEKDCFYVNNKDGSFTESLAKSFAHISKYAMGADIADYNNDGRPDVFTLDMLPEDNHRQKLLKGPDEYDQYHLLLDSGYHHQQMRNMLQLNEGVDNKGNLRFSEIGQMAGVSNTDWSWSGLLADFDNDGWKDIFVSNGYLRDFTDMDFLKYSVADAKAAALKSGNLNYQTYDLVKLMPSNKLSNYIFKNNHDLSFSNKTIDWGISKPTISNAAVYADLDNDGDLDLVVCNNNEPAMVYRNNAHEIMPAHFIKLRFKGDGVNTKAYGAKATLTTSSTKQYLELYPVRSYQSTVAQELLFGFPLNDTIRQLAVEWPDGKANIFTDVKTDTVIELKQSEASIKKVEPGIVVPKMFTDITEKSGIRFKHIENNFIDFKDEVLLPYQLSKQGPALAKGDVNGDGLEDIFIGGAIGQAGILYLQKENDIFVEAPQQAWINDSASEDVNAVFFDADKDGDLDLYVVSGGNEYADQSPEYADRLYINDGKGNFVKNIDALPAMLSSKQAIAVGDFDNDGDLDLFVGGRGVPGSFPLPSESYLLRNDTQHGVVRFTDVTASICPALQKSGMVTVAQWVDINNDHFPELVIAGDWMPVMLFNNNKGNLEDISLASGLKNLNGMWSALTATDIDGDGDVDFLLGNCGYNDQFSKTSKEQPLQLYVNDFDDNGTLDPVMCYYIQGKSYPMASRDELLDQVSPLKKKYIKYKDYADATINDIFSKEKIRQARVLYCDELASGVLYNDGHNNFSFKPLPLKAQESKIFGLTPVDFDGDGKKDILSGGNYFSYRVQLGRSDASLGLLMKGMGNQHFSVIDPPLSGVYIDGDVRAMTAIKNKSGETLIIVAKNNDTVQVLKATGK
ncbi:VCBS repeat-containing protein [Ferruginibacter paludis]|uniref:VCBS repeat-containing protein n=1 Tax=Ferruginibacter paludis TaxID=1310417 RepID=UPI0025B52EA7|nr:VCBS repeat-containing protein [Ferruginibacter paludis]MDN3655562.1 VCBS repeat-containing protein [Ferruginibacter paludis]